jgi:hypothetical protein
MKNFKSIDRLYEMHVEGAVSDEVLSMTVGELLNKLEAMDTQDSAEYEIIEDAIKTVSSKLIGYDSNIDQYDMQNSVEGEDEYSTEEFEDEELPAFNEMPGDNLASQERNNLDNFTF